MAAGREPFNMSPRPTTSHETTAGMAAAERSPWHSPVPYLFGGLAAMLGLIAFALLILACSYWKLSGYLENDGERDLEAGEGSGKEGGEGGEKKAKEYDEKFLVIMAGQVNPTYLATQVSSRSLSFGDGEKACSCGEKEGKLEGGKQGSDGEEEHVGNDRGISRDAGESSSSSSLVAAATAAATDEEETVAPH
ncbi:unnamed protein product [Linum trigynum]|uniref:Uncharacterized protein n=1 Tax=Linum trigynum TaxID=586398 RepID=A0AAV2GWZ6_9ROSI